MLFRGALALGALATLVAPGAAQARVAFVGLDGLGLEQLVVEPIEQLLTGELSRLAGGDLVSPAEVTAELVDPGLARLRSCGSDRACLIDLGGILEADVVVYGTLTQLGDNYVIQLRGLDILTSRELPRVRENLAGGRDELLTAIRAAASRLLAIDRYQGRLAIEVIPADARVTIDGIDVTLVDDLPVPVSVGQHAVTLAAPGYRTVTRMVDVEADTTARLTSRLVAVDADLAGQQPSFLSAWWPVLALGGGTVSLGLGGWFGYEASAAELDFKRAYRTNSRSDAWFDDKATSGRRYALAANVAIGLGATLVTAGLVGWLLGDDPAPPAP